MTKVNERGEFKKPTEEEVAAILGADVKERIAEYVGAQKGTAAHVVETLGLKDGTVLDVACGQAYIDIAIALACPDVRFVLVDPSELTLKVAAENFAAYGLDDRIEIVVGDEQDLPLEDGRFDYAISATPGLWPNKQQGLEEIHRVLAIGGRAYVTNIAWDNYRDYFGMMMQAGLSKFAANKDGKNLWLDIFKVEEAGEGED